MIHDKYLEQLAKAVNSESYTVPSHVAVLTSTIVIDPTITSFSGEVDDRTTLTGTRFGSMVEFTGIRSGTAVGSSSGETLYAALIMDAASGGNILQLASLPGVLHTTTFDIEFVKDFQAEREF